MSSQYLVLAEYNLVEEGELSIQEGEIVQLEKVCVLGIQNFLEG